MFFQTLAVQIGDSLPDYHTMLAAIGALGVAAFGLVESAKGIGGGLSNRGLAYIRKTLTPLLPETAAGGIAAKLSRDTIFETLKSNWVNGVASSDQQAIAKSLIKLRMDAPNAAQFAAATGVDADVLTCVIAKMSTGEPLLMSESDTYGRFDLVLTTIIGQAYQRADQQYRSTAKLVALPVSVALACIAALALNHWRYYGAHLGVALGLSIIAAPLAPVAKDLSSAVQAGVAKVLQAWKG